MSPDDVTVRLDLWLWAARFYRTRSLAKQAIDTGKVDVGGQRAKASRTVRVGDTMRIVRGDEVFEIAVLPPEPGGVYQPLHARVRVRRCDGLAQPGLYAMGVEIVEVIK